MSKMEMIQETKTSHQANYSRGILSSILSGRNINTKISVGFGSVLCITLVIAIVAFFSFTTINTKFETYAQRVYVVELVTNIDRNFLWLRRFTREFGIDGEPKNLEGVATQRSLVDQAIKAGLGEIKNPERSAKIEDVSDKFKSYMMLFQKTVEARQDFDRILKDVLDRVGLEMSGKAEELLGWAARGNGNSGTEILTGKAMEYLLLMRLGANKALARHDHAAFEATKTLYANLNETLQSLDAQILDTKFNGDAKNIGLLAKQYFESFLQAAHRSDEIDGLINHQMSAQGQGLSDDIGAIVQSAKEESKRIEIETQTLISFTKYLMLAAAAAGLLLGVVLARWISRSIASPMHRMTKAMTALAHGDLSVDTRARAGRDEIDGMAQALDIFRKAAIDKLARDNELENERARNEDERRRAMEKAIAEEREMVSYSIGTGLAKLSEKDLTFRMSDDLPQAYRQLQNDFNEALEQLETAISEVVDGAQVIGAGASQISAANDDLARRTEQTAASLEETTAALTEITGTVKRTAGGAEQASSIVGTAKSEAEKSGKIVRRAVDAMERIEKSSQKINQIISVIDEIAFQTNLLALNAGVEAARAGEAGRGFAVVASEVRALAQRSAEAAKEIKTLIAASAAEVEQGVDLVGQTGVALSDIVRKVAEIDSLISAIASDAKEEATSLTEINTAINQMDQTTQQNAAMVEEATAASHQLRRESEALMRAANSFETSRSKTLPAGRSNSTVPGQTRPMKKNVANQRG